MTRPVLALLFLTFLSAQAAFAQTNCPVCAEAAKLRDALQKMQAGPATTSAEAESLGKQGLALLGAFADNPPPPKQGRAAFEALVNLSAYAAPVTKSGDYEKALAAIGLKNPDYRKRYQAMVRKGIRAKNRRESCQMRYLQTNVSVAECKLQEAAKGASANEAARLCNTDYDLAQCLAAKR
ncbi:hypothetical protein [Pseudorhodoplanes sp.]|uniref:hypothetical protein n=1 Tax=Pseudorhodoplanes sp. TaxID=1934341 RepID=UPI002BB88C18|nr:hypothetical protein [Pseudorhodoplanes sp.]HWV43329.1 hypothetical protein [Pseudorhodoplanes sp.]